MSGELEARPTLDAQIGELRDKIRDLESRVSGDEQGLDLSDLNDVRVDSMVDAGVTLQDGSALVYRESDKIWVAGDVIGGGETYLAASVSGSITVDLDDAVVQKLTLTGNITPTFAGAVSGRAYGLTLYLVQDASPPRTVTWPAAVKWPFGSAPVLSATASAVDIVVLESFDGGTSWFANFAGKGYA